MYHRARKNAKAAEDVEYPAYGVTGPGKDTSPSSGDRKLAHNAQLYHYQHTKQQMIAFDTTQDKERPRNGGGNISESEDEGEEGDYTVYECPGLAPVGFKKKSSVSGFQFIFAIFRRVKWRYETPCLKMIKLPKPASRS